VINFKINYVDGTSQVLTSTGPMMAGDWMVFSDGVGEILRIRADHVVSVERVNGGS
jgi:CO/xanthine dehydrogenase Mo-binding subunit